MTREIRVPEYVDELDYIVHRAYETFKDQSDFRDIYDSLMYVNIFAPDPAKSILMAYEDREVAGFTIYSDLSVFDEFDDVYAVGYQVDLSQRMLVHEGSGASEPLPVPVPEEYGGEVSPYHTSITRAKDSDLYKVMTFVEPAHRKKGVASSLTQGVIVEARDREVDHIFTHCLEGSGSEEMNLAAGFHPILRIQHYYPRTEEGTVLMGKNLSDS